MDISRSSSKGSASHLNLYLSSVSDDYQSDSNPSTSHPPEASHTRSDSTEDRLQPVQVDSKAEGKEEGMKERIKREEFLRRQHERTIEDLKNRMRHLEQELASAAKEGRDRSSVVEVTERLEVALKERDEARRDCQSLQTHLSILRKSFPAPPSPALKESFERKAADLRKRIAETKDSNQQLSLKLAQLQNSSIADPKLLQIERRILTLESAFESEISKTASIQSRLITELSHNHTQPPHRQILDSVTQQISANEDKVLALEMQLATAESTFERLKKATVRKSAPCEESEDYSERGSFTKLKPRHANMKKSEPVQGKKVKKRTESERPRKAARQ